MDKIVSNMLVDDNDDIVVTKHHSTDITNTFNNEFYTATLIKLLYLSFNDYLLNKHIFGNIILNEEEKAIYYKSVVYKKLIYTTYANNVCIHIVLNDLHSLVNDNTSIMDLISKCLLILQNCHYTIEFILTNKDALNYPTFLFTLYDDITLWSSDLYKMPDDITFIYNDYDINMLPIPKDKIHIITSKYNSYYSQCFRKYGYTYIAYKDELSSEHNIHIFDYTDEEIDTFFKQNHIKFDTKYILLVSVNTNLVLRETLDNILHMRTTYHTIRTLLFSFAAIFIERRIPLCTWQEGLSNTVTLHEFYNTLYSIDNYIAQYAVSFQTYYKKELSYSALVKGITDEQIIELFNYAYEYYRRHRDEIIQQVKENKKEYGKE